ncbi:hypothetical protein ES703_25310 [subsurface metagenome]
METVEPAACLVNRLADVVRGEAPVLKQRLILKRVVYLGHRHGTRVKPAVYDLGYTPHGATALRAVIGHLINIRPVQVERLFQTTKTGFTLQIINAADTLPVIT